MTDEQPTPTRALTDIQRARIDFARRDLDSARSEDLAQLGADGLILMVERLRGRLGDALNLIDEIADA
ncbi:hypothetical protein [Streptomyces sp. OM5714]|uniref:hypothetical protein n=1 Tax=Streptomyces sp. OM5714 TaxID=2602736 RepID=UPI0013D9DEBA|nr:hypothetical protein [Streptomyces sp. OM5714]KAF2774690.1 hypothetical protein STPH1_7735 [Streptomyces sp. OM5714]